MKKTEIRFAERLKELREAAGISLAELARAIDVSDATICKWENDVAEPKISYVAKLEEYFDCSLDYLIGKDELYGETTAITKALKPECISYVAVSADEKSVLGNYKKLPPETKIAIAEVLNALARTDKRNDRKIIKMQTEIPHFVRNRLRLLRRTNKLL